MKGHLFYVKTSGLSHEAQRIKLDIALGNPIHGPERFTHPWISHVHGARSTGRNCKSLPSALNAKGFGGAPNRRSCRSCRQSSRDMGSGGQAAGLNKRRIYYLYWGLHFLVASDDVSKILNVFS